MRGRQLLVATASLLAVAAAWWAVARQGQEPLAAKEAVDRLVGQAINQSLKMALEGQPRVPFVLSMTPSGKVTPTGRVATPQLVERLRDTVERRGSVAIAIVVTGQMTHPFDGKIVNTLAVGIEHQDGLCVDVFVPYHFLEDTIAFFTRTL